MAYHFNLGSRWIDAWRSPTGIHWVHEIFKLSYLLVAGIADYCATPLVTPFCDTRRALSDALTPTASFNIKGSFLRGTFERWPLIYFILSAGVRAGGGEHIFLITDIKTLTTDINISCQCLLCLHNIRHVRTLKVLPYFAFFTTNIFR